MNDFEITSEDLREIFWWGTLVGSFVVIFIVMMFMVIGSSSKKDFNDIKFNKCIDIAVKAVPDPNDTEARDSIMKNCFENK